MTQGDEPFLKRLLETFQVEAKEHLEAMSFQVQELSRSPHPNQVEMLFREVHSLKGAARAVNLNDIEQACQELEGVLASLKKQGQVPDAELIGVLEQTIDRLASMQALRPPGSLAEPAGSDLAPVVEPSVAPVVEASAGALSAGTVRISTARLEALLIQSEELLAFKFGTKHLVDELNAVGGMISAWRRACTKRSSALRLMRLSAGRHQTTLQGRQVLGQWLDAVERDELALRSLSDRFVQIERTADRERRALSGMVDKLQDEMKQLLLLPFTSLLEMAPKLVRDLGRDCGKDVELLIHDTTLEVDRRILEQLKTPLIHLLRNAVDHGIELPQVRQQGGKPLRGRITIDLAPCEGNKVEMTVADDGGGIDVAAVKAKALKMGLYSAHALDALPDEQILGLVFESGLSTSAILSDLSGHGLGLAIAREKIDKLGGTMSLESGLGTGTRFRIVLPTALATFRGLLIALGEHQFVLPLRSVERVTRVKGTELMTMENREAMDHQGQALAVVRLHEVLELRKPDVVTASPPYLSVVVLRHANKRIALVVDEILGDQDVLIKPLRAPLKHVRHIAGATVLGAGRVVPLLDVGDLIKSAPKASAPRPTASVQDAGEGAGARPPSLLVVEDSITSRTLITGILESAGYEVHSAVDGMDALTVLGSHLIDLVVSDVEMPRLDGFDLTARIRANRQWAELPVVLVTSLGSCQDRERGVEVGANAYIVKSNFDQGNLLDVIRSLL